MVSTGLTPEKLKAGVDSCDPHALYVMGMRILDRQEEGDYGLAVDYISTAAALGHPRAQVWMGDHHSEGPYPDYDPEEAAGYYRMAAEQGSPAGLSRLASCYGRGFGVERCEPLRFSLDRKAAKRGDPDAMCDLGAISEEWCDYASAVRWLTKAAEKGHREAQFRLGKLYCEGKGADRDLRKALGLFRSAAAMGHEEAAVKAARMLRAGIGTDKDVPGAIALCQEAYSLDCRAAAREVLDIYLNEPGYADEVMARAWAFRILDEGCAAAFDLVAWMYQTGTAVERDVDRELAILEKGSSYGSIECRYQLSRYLWTDPRVEDEDKDRAQALLRECAEAGHPEAQYRLYLRMLYSDQDEAAFWLRCSAVGGHVPAMLDLAREYEAGAVVPGSVSMAIRWYMRACEAGAEEAREDLGLLLERADPCGFEDIPPEEDDKIVALEEGDAALCKTVGDRYMRGADLSEAAKAVRWYRRGAALGDAGCKDRLGFAMYHGIGGQYDGREALCYIMDAACAGLPASQYLLGIHYLEGRYVDKDRKRARALIERAAAQGYAAAIEELERLEEKPPAEEVNIEDLAFMFG